MEKRLRDKQLNIRITEHEYKMIQERMKKSGAVSLREYIVEAATKGFIINVDYTEMKNLAYEINKIGTNINQIAHKINSENTVYKSELEDIQDYIDTIWKMIRSKFYKIT